MPQELDKLNTGNKSFDDDLRELFAICGDKKKLNIIKQAIDNKDISRKDFSKVVPKSLIKLSVFLSEPQFSINLEQINKEAVDLVKKAKSLIEKHFSNLFENENARSILNKMTKGQQTDRESLADGVVRGIEYYFMWEDDPPKLTPAVHMALTNIKGKILLKTRLDWEDFSFLLKNLTGIHAELLEKGKTLAELGQIDLSDSEKVSKNIEEALGNLKKVKEIMPIYKAKNETDKNKQSVKDSSSKK